MIDERKIRGRMVEHGLNQAQLAEKMDMTSKTLSAKLRNISEMTVPEAQRLIDILALADPAAIFFDVTVTSGATNAPKESNSKN